MRTTGTSTGAWGTAVLVLEHESTKIFFEKKNIGLQSTCTLKYYRVYFRAAYLGLGTPAGLVLKFTAWVHSCRPCMHLEFHPNKSTVTDHHLIY